MLIFYIFLVLEATLHLLCYPLLGLSHTVDYKCLAAISRNLTDYLGLSKDLIELVLFGPLKLNKNIKPGAVDIEKCEGSNRF